MTSLCEYQSKAVVSVRVWIASETQRMPYYIALHPEGSTALWLVEEGARTVSRADGAIEHIDVPLGVNPLDAVRATREIWSFHALDLAPDEYYPRMARPNSQHPAESPGSNPVNYQQRSLIESGRGQLIALRYQLEEIFRVVHPGQANFSVFGHEIRNLLILAATEVEAHWKGVLAANGVRSSDTRDYVKLANALKLGEYSIKIPFYPWIEPIRPFDRWAPSATPTKDLSWYDAYQAVKHDRENQFERATLFNAIKAVCGCAVMMFAQFGTSGFHHRNEINSFFDVEEAPAWHPSETYSGVGQTPFKAVRFIF
jgi:hypothetical protein